MTIDDAIREIQGKSAGITGRATVEYAQKQLREGEKVFAAASANIQAHRGNFPGLIVFTDQRLFAASGLPGVLMFMLYGILMMAIVIMTCVLSVTRFYKNLLGLEGYLMFSLPASTASLIASKVISVLIWSALSSVTALLSFAISALGAGGIAPFRDFFEIFTYPEVLERLPSAAGLTAMFLLLAVAGTAASIVRIYAGIAIGHQFNDHRILFSILALVAFNIIGTTVMSLLGSAGMYSGVFDSLSRIFEAGSTQALYAAQAGMLAFLVLQIAFFGALTWVLLDRRLNLE